MIPPKHQGAKPHRSVWIVCQGTQFDIMPILQVDPVTRASAFTTSAHRARKIRESTGPTFFSAAIHWRSDDEMIYHYGTVYRVKPRQTLIDYSDKKLLIDIPSPNRETSITPFLPIDGQRYVPGNRWGAVNPQTLEAHESSGVPNRW